MTAKDDLFLIMMVIGGGAILVATGTLNPIFDAIKGKPKPKPAPAPAPTPSGPSVYPGLPYVPGQTPSRPVTETPIPVPTTFPDSQIYNLAKLQCSNTKLFTQTELEGKGVKLLHYQTSPAGMINCQACGICLHSYIVVATDDQASKTILLSLGFKQGRTIVIPQPAPIPPVPIPGTPPPVPIPLPPPYTGPNYQFCAVGDWDVRSAASVKTRELIAARNVPLVLGLGDYDYHNDTPAAFATVLGAIKNKFVMTRGNHETPAWIKAVNGQPSSVMTFTRGNVCFIICDSEQGDNSHALAAATAAQANPNVDWIIGTIHRPTTPYNDTGIGGDSPGRSRALISVWDRFDKARLVLSGHWHNYQRSKEIKGNQVVPKGTTYAVIGTAGANLNSLKSQGNYTAKRIEGQFGYLYVSADRTTLKAQFIAHSGSVLDDFTITK